MSEGPESTVIAESFEERMNRRRQHETDEKAHEAEQVPELQVEFRWRYYKDELPKIQPAKVLFRLDTGTVLSGQIAQGIPYILDPIEGKYIPQQWGVIREWYPQTLLPK